MDIILNYLDSMFTRLPDTEAVRKAKREMASMMEDKYTELLSEGKSENEAIGTVIAEFGNIEELAGELELDEEDDTAAGNETAFALDSKASGAADPVCEENPAYGAKASDAGQRTDGDVGIIFVGREVSMEECRAYLHRISVSARGIAFGVAMVILSVVFPVCGEIMFGTEAGEAVGAVIMFVMIAGAVALFIIHGSAISRFDYLKKEQFVLHKTTAKTLEQLQEKEQPGFIRKITLGVVLCILSVVPAVLSEAMLDLQQGWDICFLLVMVAAGVYLFITAGVNYGAYNVLLQKGDYKAKRKNRMSREARKEEKVGAVYWPVVLAIYLAYSLITSDWGRSWIIWPVAAVLFEAVAAVAKSRIK